MQDTQREDSFRYPETMSSETSPERLAAMRALAHPTRVAIVRLLRQHAALTATQCANTLGLSAKTCSYHLQTLASAGVVVEVVAAGRNRPWRLADGSGDATADPLRQARETTRQARVRRDESVLGHAIETVTRLAGDAHWAQAATVYTRVASMSAEELTAWGEDVERLTRRHVRRAAQSAEVGENVTRSPVRLMFYGFPTTAPA
jgi:DNA-binding transcriptional ArsR family regulator